MVSAFFFNLVVYEFLFNETIWSDELFLDDSLNDVTDFIIYIRNYPLLMATWKIAPALAAGCAAILKPSESASVYVLINYCKLDYNLLRLFIVLCYCLQF